jgi:hypothetical protein
MKIKDIRLKVTYIRGTYSDNELEELLRLGREGINICSFKPKLEVILEFKNNKNCPDLGRKIINILEQEMLEKSEPKLNKKRALEITKEIRDKFGHGFDEIEDPVSYFRKLRNGK